MNIHGTRIRTTVVFATAIVLAACSGSGNDDPAPAPQSNMAPLRFEVDGRGSRAEISTATLSRFTVWGAMRASGSTGTWSPVFGSISTTVSYDAANGWTYPGDLRYWQQDNSYTFVAFAAAYDNDAVPRVEPVYNTAASGNGHYLSFSDFNGTYATDMVYAVEARDVTDDPTTTTAVSLAFQHLTSRLEIMGRVDPQLSGHTVTVHSVKLYGMNTTGSWDGSTFNPAASVLGTWTSATPSTAAAPYASHTGSIVLHSSDAEPSHLFPAGAVLMIPQEVPVDARVVVTYTTADDNAERSLMLNLYEASLDMGAEWRPGMNYRYTVNFGAADYILFDTPVVEQWTYQMGGNIIVQ